MKPVVIVIGTRPEAIKMLPVVKALRATPGVKPLVISTGQHREMLGHVFAAFEEKADLDLDLMTPGQTLAEVTTRVLTRMDALYAKIEPALVLVHGDTTTAMAAAMAAFYREIPVGHVEAGLRSHDVRRPWPEEYNRLVIDAVASLLYPPTESAAANLRRETPAPRSIEVTGNTGIDALLYIGRRIDDGDLGPAGVMFDPSKRLILVTGHRRESFGGGFDRICDAIARIAARPDVEIVYPVHLNPEVQRVVARRLHGLRNVRLIPPIGYVEMVALMKRATLLLTDSGGIQEEAPALGKPVLVMRDVTERPEAVEAGVASLVGTDADLIVAEVGRLLDDKAYYASRARAIFPYGDGEAAGRIAASVARFMERV